MFRDKDYLRTTDGLIFNVIGYEHDAKRTTVNLKYVDSLKWTAGYEAAFTFLEKRYPWYVSDLISVPESHVAEVYRPQDGLRRLLAQADRNDLEQAAVDLARECSKFFRIPQTCFGVTDSLLWGRGNDDSDVDLVVYGKNSALRVLSHISLLFDQPGFVRPDRETLTRQSTISDPELRELLLRKVNKGIFRGVRFSLRAVRAHEEIIWPTSFRAVSPIEITARVTDHSESLFFPATYTMDSGLNVVSFLMPHEGVFKPGDVLTVTGTLERGNKDRVVVGSLYSKNHKISLHNTSQH